MWIMPRDLTVLVALTSAISTCAVNAESQVVRLPAPQINIDEDILAAFVDEPCRNFEAARDRFTAGELNRAAEHLRTAAAFLRLEAARATPDGKVALDGSIDEIRQLAFDVQNGHVGSRKILEQVFARAHYALARHHCIKSACRCRCAATFQDQQKLTRAGRDLEAATIHLERGALWAGDELGEDARRVLEDSRLTANQLIGQKTSSQTDVDRAIHAVRGKLEGLTGRKIMLAPPLFEDDTLGPSVFQ